ncbi:hypothetical protein ACHAXS_004704 [Conticribra weissflogii]
MSTYLLLVAVLVATVNLTASYTLTAPSTSIIQSNFIPKYSFTTGIENKIYTWRNQQIRYIVTGPPNAKQSVLLIHGLFVNADHWRRVIFDLGRAGYRTYAIDLLGSGYSSKPNPKSVEAHLLNGENGRFLPNPNETPEWNMKVQYRAGGKIQQQPPTKQNVILGTSSGGRRVSKYVDLRHPTNSCYNFYTWAEQVEDFTRDIIFKGKCHWSDGVPKSTSLIANSKGVIVALQAMLDRPKFYNGICAINPTYREMHESELKFPWLTMPVVRLIQKFLKSRGKGIYKVATQKKCIMNMLKEPYAKHEAIDDVLVTSLMAPLNLPGAAEVVFDELSYTSGPLFEQLLQDLNDSNSKTMKRKPVWVCYGKKDPWLSIKRVESLKSVPFREGGDLLVDEVIGIDDAGHCPMDEVPEKLNPVLLTFLHKALGQPPDYYYSPVDSVTRPFKTMKSFYDELTSSHTVHF